MAGHVCPVWAGYLQLNPLRRWLQNPDKILGPHIEPGMTVLDIGCAMGYFSLPLARMVGPQGKVICVDMQERMLRVLNKRARKASLSGRVQTHVCAQDTLGLDDLAGTADFALACAVAHEVSDPGRFFAEIHDTLKPTGRLLLAEPPAHVKKAAFDATVSIAGQQGFQVVEQMEMKRFRCVAMEKQE